MLRSNTKKAIQNIKGYVIANCDFSNYGIETPMDFSECATFIMKTFYTEFYSYERRNRNIQESFADWLSGLPSVIDSCYYYNRSAVDDVAKLLDETDEEKSRYTEEEAERLLSYLIYREVSKASKFTF